MSEKLPYMVFSGTKSKYLAEKICSSLGCQLGNLQFLTKNPSVVAMYFWYSPHSPIPIT